MKKKNSCSQKHPTPPPPLSKVKWLAPLLRWPQLKFLFMVIGAYYVSVAYTNSVTPQRINFTKSKHFIIQNSLPCYYCKTGVSAGQCFTFIPQIIHLPRGGHCPLFRDSEPIRFLEMLTSLSLYMLIRVKDEKGTFTALHMRELG